MQPWIIPLTVLPGIGLIIMSTSNLVNGLTGEINLLMDKNRFKELDIIERKISQLGLLNRALVALYISAAACALAGCLGAILHQHYAMEIMIYEEILFGAAILALFMATIMLIIYAYRAVRIKREQFRRVLKREGELK